MMEQTCNGTDHQRIAYLLHHPVATIHLGWD
jgi:hypothetical protein